MERSYAENGGDENENQSDGEPLETTTPRYAGKIRVHFCSISEATTGTVLLPSDRK